MVFVPGGQVSTAYLPAWTCLLYFSFTLIDLSTDYSERSRVTVWGKESGPVVFLTGFIVMGFYGFVDNREQLWLVAVLIVGSLPVLMLTMVCTVSERKPDRVGDMAVVGWAAGL